MSAPSGPKMCEVCGTRMDPVIASLMSAHPGCYGPGGTLPTGMPPPLPAVTGNPFGPPPSTKVPMSAEALALRSWVLDMIHWRDDSSARSQQVTIGPSEIGTKCARKLAYKIAGVPKINGKADPWPAIQGTAIHAWMADAVKAFAQYKGWNDALVEFPVIADTQYPIGGTSDCYHDKTIIDWKSAGKDKLAEVSNHGAPDEHIVQVNTYGVGARHRGVEVERVALVYLPRGGRLQDTYVVVKPFEPQVAYDAMERVWRIDNNLKIIDIRNHPEHWNMIPATPDHNCGYCPFFVADPTGQAPATDRSCPGRATGGEK